MYLPENVLFVLDRLESNEYNAYLVGGCVRDSVMGKIPNDYDITTNARPEKILECFSDCKTLTNGIKHGTVGILVQKDLYEVTTYRIDGEYSDNRHPDKVEFSADISDDLSRRDFTVNAIACNKSGDVVDPFDGVGDIQRKIIKCVGEPDRRFDEDALRILRALRFSSVLDFDIEKETAKSIHAKAHLLKNVSAERINTEFTKLLCGKRAGMIIREFSDVIAVFADTLENNLDVKKVADAIDNCDSDVVTRLCVFLGSFLDSSQTEAFMRAMKYDNETRTTVVSVVALVDEHFENNKISVKKLVFKYGFDVCTIANYVQFLLGRKSKKEHLIFANLLDEIRANDECTSVSGLVIDGNDCKKMLGLTGKDIGLVLEYLCNAVIEEKVSNEYEVLLEYARDYLKQRGEKTND